MEHHNGNFITRNNLAVPISIVIAGALIACAIYMDKSGGRVAGPVGAPAKAPVAQAVDSSKLKLTGPMVGNTNAPVTIAIWTDYQCPFCARFEKDAVEGLYNDYVKTGKARIYFKDFAFLGEDSITAGIAGHAVWEAAPAKYYAWRTNIYAKQGQEHSGWATKEKVLALSANVLTPAEIAKVSSLMDSKKSVYQAALDADKAEGASFGVNGTPGTVIGKTYINGAQGYATVKAAVEKTLSGK